MTNITFFWDAGPYITTLDDTFKESFASLVGEHGMPNLHDVRPGDFYGNPQYWQPVRSADGDEDSFVPRRPEREIALDPVPDTAVEEIEEVETRAAMKTRMRDAFKKNLRMKKLL